MPIGYLCQWIFYAVFAVGSACCVPVSHADVLTHSAFRAVYGGGALYSVELHL